MKSIVKTGFLLSSISPLESFASSTTKSGVNLLDINNSMSMEYVIQIILSFIVVVGLIFLIAWLIKRSGKFGYGSKQNIKILSTVSLGMREKILLIDINGETIVVGIAPGQIRTLYVLNNKLDHNEEEGTESIGTNNFRQLIDTFKK